MGRCCSNGKFHPGWAASCLCENLSGGLLPTPRIALWHELCTYGQPAPPVLETLRRSGLELRMGSIRGTAAVLRQLRATEDHRVDDRLSATECATSENKEAEDTLVGIGSLAIRGVPSAKTGFYGWQRLVGLDELARTSGSWGNDNDEMGPPGTVEVVPRGYVLKGPEDPFYFPSKSSRQYGTRAYLKPENMMPVSK